MQLRAQLRTHGCPLMHPYVHGFVPMPHAHASQLVDEFLQGFGRVLFSDMPVQRPSYRFFSTAIAAGAKCTPANGPF